MPFMAAQSAAVRLLELWVRIPPGRAEVCPLWLVLLRGVLPSVVCLSVISKPRQGGGLLRHEDKNE
jgi:hypothetical protein